MLPSWFAEFTESEWVLGPSEYHLELYGFTGDLAECNGDYTFYSVLVDEFGSTIIKEDGLARNVWRLASGATFGIEVRWVNELTVHFSYVRPGTPEAEVNVEYLIPYSEQHPNVFGYHPPDLLAETDFGKDYLPSGLNLGDLSQLGRVRFTVTSACASRPVSLQRAVLGFPNEIHVDVYGWEDVWIGPGGCLVSGGEVCCNADPCGDNTCGFIEVKASDVNKRYGMTRPAAIDFVGIGPNPYEYSSTSFTAPTSRSITCTCGLGGTDEYRWYPTGRGGPYLTGPCLGDPANFFFGLLLGGNFHPFGSWARPWVMDPVNVLNGTILQGSDDDFYPLPTPPRDDTWAQRVPVWKKFETGFDVEGQPVVAAELDHIMNVYAVLQSPGTYEEKYLGPGHA